jgi:PPOX class probable F420-dependent enzyme
MTQGQLTDDQRLFLEQARLAAMVTLRRDGSPHAVRVGVALIDGKIWSSGLPDRVRTRHVRRDPRCTFIVFGSGYGYLTIEGRVTILDGPDAPDQSVHLFRAMQAGAQPGPPPGHLMWQGKPLSTEEFRRAMVEERRLIYELTIERAYGLLAR